MIRVIYNDSDETMFIPTDLIIYIIELKQKHELEVKTEINKVYGRKNL